MQIIEYYSAHRQGRRALRLWLYLSQLFSNLSLMVTLRLRRRGYKRKRDCDSDSDCPMDSEMNIQDVVRVARRVYVGNLAWKTSWQDLKVRLKLS